MNAANTTSRDPRLARTLAGPAFRRADTERDERSADAGHAAETFLHSLRGWLAPQRIGRRAVDRIGAAVSQAAQPLKHVGNDEVARRFHDSLKGLKASARPMDEASALATVFACVGEGSRRSLGLWPHPVQFTGARLLLSGCLAEMQPGEGKSLVAALAAAVMAASGAAAHVISTNDYLAERDCAEMSPLFAFFGLAASFVKGGMEADERRAAYAHPICYVSGKELVFDYLKDRLAGHGLLPARVSRLHAMWHGGRADAAAPTLPALHFAIVDEADSVLIDEARTPMILSREAPGLYEPALLRWAIEAARGLQAGRDFDLASGRLVELRPSALRACAPLPQGVRAAWRSRSWRELLLRQALTALHLFVRDQHYILSDGKVQIVDESTGRVMADRSWEQGLHQLIEVKEGLEVSNARETLSRMTFQRFFLRYYLLSGLTGTAAEASRELWTVYRLRVKRLPPHRANQRARAPDCCVPTLAQKWHVVADHAMAAAARSQPVLVGTRSVEASEQIAAELARRGVEHVVLNARQDADEARIVAQAGTPGRITVATNMAGRGTDIKPTPEARQAGGLHVLLTEFHESPRVDRQLFGRCGRQGDPGTQQAIVSLQDPLFAEQPRWLRHAVAASRGRLRRFWLERLVRMAQARAERSAYRTRMQTLRQDRELHRLIGFAGPTT